MAFTNINWEPGETYDLTRLDQISGNDDYLKAGILSHTHDGSDSRLLVKASDSVQGAVVINTQKSSISSSSSQAFYLTDDGTSGGDSLFDEPPFVVVGRGDSTDFDLQEVGHSAAGTKHYHYILEWDSGNSCWKVTVHNNDASNSYTFWVQAVGS